MIKTIIFDWSGVLSNDLEATYLAGNDVLKIRGLRQITLQEFQNFYTLPWINFYKNFNITVDRQEENTLWEQTLPKYIHLIKPYPFAERTLKILRKNNIEIIVLTARSTPTMNKELENSPLTALIDKVYSQQYNKTEFIHKLLESHKLKKENVLYIGDTTHDIETAKQAGVTSVAVLKGYQKKEDLLRENPDYSIQTAEELPELIEKINRKAK